MSPLSPISPLSPMIVGASLRELVGQEVTDIGPTGEVLTGYVIDSVLGEGGMSVAFLAHVRERDPNRPHEARPGRPPPGTRCVVKAMLPAVVLRASRVAQLSYKKEVIALARLAEKVPPSPFVVRYLDAGLISAVTHVADGLVAAINEPLLIPWCALELVDGRPLGTTLEERIYQARGPLEPARAAALIEGIVRGVRAVHSVGVVHRDLKPSNVLVCGEPPNELPKITDFGVARAVGIGETFDVSVGTTGYASPEQLEGPGMVLGKSPGSTPTDPLGPWSDVFALGAIFYEILTRTPMFESITAMAFLGKVLSADFKKLVTCNLGPAYATAEGLAVAARWDTLLAKATSPNSPGGGNIAALADQHVVRYRDVDDLFDDLEPLLADTRALAVRVQLSPSIARQPDQLASQWQFHLAVPSGEPLRYAAVRSDGVIIGAGDRGLLFFDGHGWTRLPTRPNDEATVGVLQGGLGAFVVVRATGEVEVLPGGGGSFSLRLPFGVRSARALGGDPLGTAYLALHTSLGDWQIVRLRGRLATTVARLGGSVEVHAMLHAPLRHGDVLVVAGRTTVRSSLLPSSSGPMSAGPMSGGPMSGVREEPFVSVVDLSGRTSALPTMGGLPVDALALDADGGILLAGSQGSARIDPNPEGVGASAWLASARLDPSPVASPGGLQALTALPDGQVFGFGPGTIWRRGAGRSYRALVQEPSLAQVPVLAAVATGARMWSVHADGRVLVGTLDR